MLEKKRKASIFEKLLLVVGLLVLVIGYFLINRVMGIPADSFPVASDGHFYCRAGDRGGYKGKHFVRPVRGNQEPEEGHKRHFKGKKELIL